ncbi:DUF1858 domain-containing protein [Dysgonomonas sp. ZJ709]|uniref:DUF1858 domain-containing protein n=1 Tax=Dysgonomonas sp. ZJ709 TaxID=2709797 RepID=UPI0013EAB215|nr:DUF1858 domain-containing protein [Dysgonomonas sp. ZJ709]
MDINLHTKVADLLFAYPQLEGKLLELSPRFGKLQNPILRRTVAKMTSLQQAAKIAEISPGLMIQSLREAAGLLEEYDELEDNNNEYSTNPPLWFNKENIKIFFDACPIIDAGKSPMQTILKLASELNGEEILQIKAPFRPIPIIDILKSQGYEVWCYQNDNFFKKTN